MSARALTLVFDGKVLSELTDDWNLFTIGITTVDIASHQALQFARNAVNGYSWSANNTTVSNFNVVSESMSVIFQPLTKNGLVLYPVWNVTFYLERFILAV